MFSQGIFIFLYNYPALRAPLLPEGELLHALRAPVVGWNGCFPFRQSDGARTVSTFNF